MKKISIIGMGYVGVAMGTLIASTKKGKNYKYFVTGIEQATKNGQEISRKINSGILPIQINDNNWWLRLNDLRKLMKNSKNSQE